MSSPKNWDLQIDPIIYKELKQIPRRYAEAILKIINVLKTNPYFGDIQKIKGEDDVWRRRIGVYRLFYKIYTKEKIILIFRVERRNSKTY